MDHSNSCISTAYSVASTNVMLIKIEGPRWYTIYHHFLFVNRVVSNPSIHQPTNGKRRSIVAIVYINSTYLSQQFITIINLCMYIIQIHLKSNFILCDHSLGLSRYLPIPTGQLSIPAAKFLSFASAVGATAVGSTGSTGSTSSPESQRWQVMWVSKVSWTRWFFDRNGCSMIFF